MTELTNNQRRCLGLEEIPVSWDRMELGEGNSIYFDGDTIRKETAYAEGFYRESSMMVETEQNRTMLVPKNSRGKLKKLTRSHVLDRASYGMYLQWDRGVVTLANYTTQVTYYTSAYEGIRIDSKEAFTDWLERWEKETTSEGFREIQGFAAAKRKHCRYQEGDFFRFRFDRRTYGYGRILFDIGKWKKAGNPFWDILMGKALVVQLFHIVTEDPHVPMEELAGLPVCPSQFIMDNIFYHGECELIGNMPLTGEVDYPVMYGRSIDARDPDKIIFCRGREYRECSAGDVKPVRGDYRNNSIGWSLKINKAVMEECIRKNSNMPYWDQELFGLEGDLRNPKNRHTYKKIRKQMGGTVV